jgi:DNA repair protein RecN (Recombination protein N)
VVEGVFRLAGQQKSFVESALKEAGVELEPDEEISIRRELQVSGRRRILVNDQAVPVSVLKAIQPRLVEILGQGEQHTLDSSRTHLEILDAFAGCAGLRVETAVAFEDWRQTEASLRQLLQEKSERSRLEDYLRFQIGEVEKVNPRPCEDEELAAERLLQANAERALELCTGAYAQLYEDDRSALARLASVRKGVEELQSIDRSVGEWVEAIRDAELKLGDVAESLRVYGGRFDYSPERLSAVESRLAELERLKKKYGADIGAILQLKGELKKQLEELEGIESKEAELRIELERAEKKYLVAARRLSETRREAAPRFESRVMEECRHLALERARFAVSIETAGAETENEAAGEGEVLDADASSGRTGWTPQGIDRVEFSFSANEGEAVRPLARVASGGELSRLMLALRTVSHDRGAADGGQPSAVTVVFDEVDAGIGGRTAEAVGRRLKSLAAAQQVVCVTHQPQIARFADHHFKVSKTVEGGRTRAGVRELGEAERVGELARMIGGSEDVEEARATARWMLVNREASAAPPRETKGRRRAGTKA